LEFDGRAKIDDLKTRQVLAVGDEADTGRF